MMGCAAEPLNSGEHHKREDNAEGYDKVGNEALLLPLEKISFFLEAKRVSGLGKSLG